MIPNILWQTWKTKDIPKSLSTHFNSWSQSNPQLERRFMNDEECSKFILEHFGQDVYDLYLKLPQNIMRADFWRIAVVYVYGGYYSDLDIICNVELNDIIQGNPSAIFTKELNNISNFFFGAEPKHPVLKMTLDYMIENTKEVVLINTQDFGMHPLHHCVKEYYNIIDTNYNSNQQVFFIENEKLNLENKFIHTCASLGDLDDYNSWRKNDLLMQKMRENTSDVLFFTTFNKNGYDLYGKDWIKSFIQIANYYDKFHAKIYYEGFDPKETHPNITWVKYEKAILNHPKWKQDYLSRTNHSNYVKTMTVRFSHKAFVIQHVLDNESHDYLIWLDGDCVFKESNYINFPQNILDDRFLACQVEHNHDLNHIESGILIFDGNHPGTQKFNQDFKKWYQVDHILEMGQPYDGFIVYKSLLTSELDYVNLNQEYGKGGIQSDPSMTFCHPEINSKFIHNIGWTGKNQYRSWEKIVEKDEVYMEMKNILFGNSSNEFQEKKKKSREKLSKLKKLKLSK